ncbi:MAG: hypothetical protein WKG01_05770 [Kofleriaceae bacterium]
MKAIRDWWFAPAPAERLAALRILVGSFGLVWVAVRFSELMRIAHLPHDSFRPIGVVRILEQPLVPELAIAYTVATLVLMALFVAGVAYRYVAPLAAAALLWTLSYRNSWGMPFHTENLLVLHMLALAVTPAADVWAVTRVRRTEPTTGYGWAIKLLVALTCATYLLAGIAKLRIAGLAWLDGDLLRNQIAVDNVRKALLGDHVAPFATLVLDHPRALIGFCGLTLLIELGAPVALAGGRVARVWAVTAWGFHLGVILVMNIWFLYPLVGVALAPMFRVERPFVWAGARVRNRGR